MLQMDRDDPVGDLAFAAAVNSSAPKEATTEQWRIYLRHHPGACRDALEQAIDEFEESEE